MVDETQPGDGEPTPERQAVPADDRWGEPIRPEHTDILRTLADQQRAWAAAPDHQGRKSYFDGVRLTGADVFWLAAYALAGPDGDVAVAQERLRTARDRDEYIDLSALHLEGVGLSDAHNMRAAHLEGANLRAAHLERADLSEAHLERAVLREAHLERARLRAAHLAGGDLRLAFFDTATTLNEVILGNQQHGYVALADVRWGGVNLAVVDWTTFTDRKAVLGDEQTARDWKPEPFTETEEERKRPRRERARAHADHAAQQDRERLELFQAAVRANRQLAMVLRDQGMNEEADHFAYRAQVVQRRVFHLQGKRIRAGFSRFLDLLAGYGYAPQRSLIWYVVTVLGFAALYLVFAHLPPQEAIILSVTSFHGRGFPGSLSLHDPIMSVAAAEAIFGLLIEISFIATFTQRFFAR